MAKQSLKKDTVFYAIALVIERVGGLLVLWLFAKYLGQNDYGIWSQVITVYALLSNVLQLGFYHALLRYVSGHEREQVSAVFYGMNGIIAVNCLLFTAVCLLLPEEISFLMFGDSEFQFVISIAALFIVSECFYEFVVVAFLRAENAILTVSGYSIVKTVLRLVAIIITVTVNDDFYVLFEYMIVVNVLLIFTAWCVSIRPRTSWTFKRPDPGFWSSVLRYSIPIVLSTNLSWAVVSINRFLVVHYLSLSDVAVYAANFAVASMVSVISLIINFTMLPRMNALWNSGEKKAAISILRAGSDYYFYLVIPIAVLLMFHQEVIVSVITSSDYVSGGILMGGLVIFFVLFGFEQVLAFASFLHDSTYTVKVRAIGLLINIVLNLILIPEMGLEGTAIAGLVTVVIILAMNLKRVKDVVSFEMPWKSVLIYFIAALSGGYVGLIIVAGNAQNDLVWSIISAVCGLLLYVMIESLRGKKSISRSLIHAGWQSFPVSKLNKQ